MVECQLPKLDVAGSTPVSRSNFSIAYDLLLGFFVRSNPSESADGRSLREILPAAS